MRVLAVFFLLALAACASSPGSGAGGAGQTVITQAQITETGASSLYDVVRVLHRDWLPRRQGSYVVVADENHLIWGRIDASDTRDELDRDAGLSRFMKQGGAGDFYGMEFIRDNEAASIWSEYVGDRDLLGAIIIWTRPHAND
jgi:hypothetical protein